jgi:serine protease Do
MSFFDKLKNHKFLPVTLMLFTLCIGILIGTLATTGVKAAKEQNVAPDATPLVIPNATRLPSEFTELAKKIAPSVVNIATEYTPRVSSNRRNRNPDAEEEEGDQQMDPNELFRRFFRSPDGMNQPPQQFRRQGTGSGIIVDRNGYIITNMHVVDKADKITVKMPDDPTEYRAKLIGQDRETDLAVIKISPGKPLSPVRIGNSDAVEVGDWAVAIGSPFGLENTVTVGIISAKGRDTAGAAQFQRFIQTDAAINPGNSGGPLLNRQGELIGVNTAIATRSGGYEGIGFALPANMAVKVYNSIITTGRVTRGSIGISFRKDEKPETLKALGVSGGVLIDSVVKGGPAEKAGLQKEDIITHINGKSIKDGDDLVARISDTPIGNMVDLTVDRNGKKVPMKVKVEDRTEVFAGDPRITGPREELPEKVGGTSNAKFGIAIVNLADAELERLGLEEKGVQVTRVEPDSFAEEIGIQDRDVIVSINRQPVTSVDDVRKIQATLKPGDAVAFRVLRSNPMTRNQRGQQSWTGFYASGTLPRNP